MQTVYRIIILHKRKYFITFKSTKTPILIKTGSRLLMYIGTMSKV